jgi:hypothetical protein
MAEKDNRDEKHDLIISVLEGLAFVAMFVCGLILFCAVGSAIQSDSANLEKERAEQQRLADQRIHENSVSLDIAAQKVIDNAPPVTIRILEVSPKFDSCRTVIWQIPANVIQRPTTQDWAESPRIWAQDTPSENEARTEMYLKHSPVVSTDFNSAQGYIEQHPEIAPVIEPGCIPVAPKGAVKVNSALFPEGTVAMGLPY